MDALNPGDLKSRLVGVIAFCPTPFREDEELDLGDLALQIDFLCKTAASSIVVCGGVGEFYALDADEHRAVVETAVQASSGRLPVIVGIGASTRAACRLAEHAAAAGAAGLLLNPLHFVEPERAGLRLHYEAVGAASALGTIIFSHRLASYDVGTLRALAGVETVVGLKDEVGDLRAFVQARAQIGDRLAWINGTGEVLAAAYVAAGAQAMTSGIVNFAPELTFSVWNAAAAGRFAEVGELVARSVQPISELRERRGGYSTTVVKEAMNLRGRPGGSVRAPLLALRPDERAELDAILKRLPPLAASSMPALVGR